jgi:hypothetical protein
VPRDIPELEIVVVAEERLVAAILKIIRWRINRAHQSR